MKAVLPLGITALLMDRPAADFSGTCLLKFQDQPIFKLSLAAEKGGVTG